MFRAAAAGWKDQAEVVASAASWLGLAASSTSPVQLLAAVARSGC